MRGSVTPERELDPEPRIDKISFSGPAGVIVGIGCIIMFVLGLPELRWFVYLALVVGIGIALALYLWHKRYPRT